MIIDNSFLFRAGLEHLLTGSQFRVTASGSSLADLPTKAVGNKRVVALIGLSEAMEALLPQITSLAERGVRVVVLTECFSSIELLAAIKSGAAGYLQKDKITRDALVKSLEIVQLEGAVMLLGTASPLSDPGWFDLARISPPDALEPVAQGVMPPSIGSTQAVKTPTLSPREQTILQWLTQGASNKHVARELGIAEHTVRVHLKSLFRKLGVNNRTKAAMWGSRYVQKSGSSSNHQDNFNKEHH